MRAVASGAGNLFFADGFLELEAWIHTLLLVYIL